MPAEFAAEDSLGFGERFFHERMPDAFSPRHATGSGDFIGYDVARSQIVNDRCAFILRQLQEIPGQKRRDQIAADRLAFFIYKHAAVGVAVETGAKIRM